MTELSANIKTSFEDVPDRSWCVLRFEKDETRLEVCEDCPEEEPFCRKNCEIFIEEAYA